MNFFQRIVRVNIQKKLNSQFTQQLRNKLETTFFYKPTVLAVYIDSDGGSVVQAKQISHLLQTFSKQKNIPMICFAGSKVLNSANIILSAGDKIIAAKNSDIGDLTFGTTIWNAAELVEKHNIKVVDLSHGEHKARFNPFSPLKDGDKLWLKQQYEDFELDLKETVIKNLSKKINRQQLQDPQFIINKQAIITGQEAQQYQQKIYNKIRIIDELGTIDDYLEINYPKLKTINLFPPQIFNIYTELIDRVIQQ